MMFAGMKSNSRQLERSKHEQSIEIDDNEKSLDTVEDVSTKNSENLKFPMKIFYCHMFRYFPILLLDVNSALTMLKNQPITFVRIAICWFVNAVS